MGYFPKPSVNDIQFLVDNLESLIFWKNKIYLI